MSLVEKHRKSFSDDRRISTMQQLKQSYQVEKHPTFLANDKHLSIVQHLKQERALREELCKILEYASLNDIPLEERRKAAEKPLYLARYE
jgi:DNA-binding MltR family transcriptional regulator